MIFNVNAAAVAALALTMAVHAAPSGLVGHELLGCDNDNDVRGADFGNHREDGDRPAVIRVSVGDRDDDSRANSNRANDSSRQTDSNRASDESRRTDSNRANDDSRRTDSNRASDNSRAESDRASQSLVDAHIVTDSNRASDESRRTDSNRANDDSRRTDSNRANDDSRRTDSNRASDESRRTESNHASESLVDARIQTTHRNIDDDARNRDARETHDNSRCNDCKSEFWHEEGFLKQVVGEVSEVKHGVLRVEHLTERCSPEESARRCGPDCNGFMSGWNGDKSFFDLFCFDKAIHSITSELDVLLSKRRENGWKPQYHYEC